MERKMMAYRVWAMSLAVLAMSAVISDAAVSCSNAVNALIPCGSFLVGSGAAKPSPQCCTSAQALNKMAVTRADRQAVCQCFVRTGPSFGVTPARARLLPPLCRLRLNIPVSPTTDCTKVT